MTTNNPVEPSEAMLPCPWCEQHLVWDCENDVWRHQNAGFCIGEQVLVEAKKVTAWNTRPAMQSAAPVAVEPSEALIERVARAICLVNDEQPDALDEDSEPKWHFYAIDAEEAIAAMQPYPHKLRRNYDKN